VARAVVIALAALTSVALAGAALAGGAGARADMTLRVNISETDIQHLDPALDYEFYGWSLIRTACVTLMSYPDEAGAAGTKLIPEGAVAFPRVSKDGRTYTFRIRKGFRFNTGEPMTAESFARAFERALHPKMASAGGYFMGDLVGASAVLAGKAKRPAGIVVRGDTLTIKLTAPSADLLARLALTFYCAVPTSLEIDPKGVKLPPMAGPYYFVDRQPGHSVTLARNPNYGGTRPQNWERIQVTVNTSTQTSLLQVRKGDADFDLTGIPPAAASQLEREYGVNQGRYWVHPLLGFNYLALNTARPLLDDVTVRKAISFAIDRQVITNIAGKRAGRPADQIVPPGIPGYRDVSIYPWRSNIERAKALMAGRTGKLKLYVSAGQPYESQAQTIRASLKQIGLDVTVRVFPFTTLVAKVGTISEPYDMVQIGWFADYADPYDFINVLLHGDRISKTNNVNFSQWNDPTFNALMDKAATLRGEARYTAYARLDERIMREAVPIVPFNIPNIREFTSKRIGCYAYSPTLGAMNLTAACLR
jgi:ABC-type transport system substrate-binding protein